MLGSVGLEVDLLLGASNSLDSNDAMEKTFSDAAPADPEYDCEWLSFKEAEAAHPAYNTAHYELLFG